MNKEIKIYCSKNWSDSNKDESYELLDTGEGEKLERFGKYTFARPYADAVWKKTLSTKEWNNVDGKFWSSKTGAKSGWTFSSKEKLAKWEMSYGDINPVRGREGSQRVSTSNGIKFWALPTSFRHLSFFPEQASHWDFIEEQIKNSKRKIKFLNLFGYTGVASLFALRAGAEVTHLDASKQSLMLAKDNEKLSNLNGLRIIEDDVLKFLEREVKRGNKYDAIIMDPPKFGRGTKGEIWKLEEDLPKLLSLIKKVLSDNPLFVILTSYATDSSALSLGYALAETMKGLNGNTEQGELCVLEKSNNRLISLAHTAVWINNR